MLDLSSLVNAYSKSKHGSDYLSANFQVREFACKDGSDVILINILLPFVCQCVRNWFNYPFTPNSAYRTITYNAKENGAAASLHIYGNAVDIPCSSTVTPYMLYKFLDILLGNTCELGIYNWGVHVGIQNTKKRFVDSGYTGEAV